MEQAFPANLGYAMDSYAQAINDKLVFLFIFKPTPTNSR